MNSIFSWVLFLCVSSVNFSIAAEELQPSVVELLKPKLNSDRIEYFFGNYGVDPLSIDSPAFPHSRIANLYSIDQGNKIMRTLAVVDFFQPVHSELADVHREIDEGKSIGIALREKGWTIHKNPVYFGELELSASVMSWMREEEFNSGAVYFYQLYVSKQDMKKIPYCTILEVYSPQYLTQEWLQALYEDQYVEFSALSKEAADFIARLSLLMQDFP